MQIDIKSIVLKPIVPQVLCGLAALFFALQLYSFIDILVNGVVLTPLPTQAAVVIKEEQPTQFLNSPLFGDYFPDNLDESKIKRSTLQLTVVGILFSLHETDSIVTIRTKGQGERMFHVGDTVPGGAVIKRIMPDGVLLMRAGAMERLSLPKNELKFEPMPKPLKGDDNGT